MGHPPEVIMRMTFWEFSCAVDGWKKSNGVEDDDDMPNREEMRAALNN